MKASLRREVFSLPEDQRIKLARDLLDSVVADFAEVTHEEMKFLEARLAADMAHPSAARPWEEVKASLKSKRRKRA